MRIVQEGDRCLFCAFDVARALGYSRPNDAVSRHCRATVKRSSPISGKMQEINFIPEGDVYRLIVHSKLPSAERFERWVFDEVLPSLRKNGIYITDPLVKQFARDPDFAHARRFRGMFVVKERRTMVTPLGKQVLHEFIGMLTSDEKAAV